MDRRQLLSGGAAVVAGASTAAFSGFFSPAALAAQGKLQTSQIKDRLTLISGGGGNVVAFHSDEGLLLIDSGAPVHASAVLKAALKVGPHKRVHTLFNTHWHHDQTGGNLSLGRAGTRIIAHENTRLWLTTDVELPWEKRHYQPMPKQALPTQTFYTTGTLKFGGEQIDYGYMPQAHTDGDIYVHFRNANVIVGGDVLAKGAFPIIDHMTNGWVGGMWQATQVLAQLGNAETRYVAGQGALLTHADVLAEQEMLKVMRERLAKILTNGFSIQEMLDANPAGEFVGQWGDPTLFIQNAWYGLVHRARELGVSIV